MNSGELKSLLKKKLNWSQVKVDALLTAWCETITEVLANGETIIIPGFGSFYIMHLPSKTILDPQGRGHKIIMLPTNVAKFRASEQLKNKTKSIKITDEEEEEIERVDWEEKKLDMKKRPSKNLDIITLNKLLQKEKVKTTNKETFVQKHQQAESVQQEINKKFFPKIPSKEVNIKFRNLAGIKIDKEVLSLIPQNIAERYKVAPIELVSGKLTVAMVDPENINTVELLKKITQLEIEPVLSTSGEIENIIDQYTGLQNQIEDVIAHSDLGITTKELKQAEKENIEEETDDSPTIRIVYSLLKQAVRERASDIHIEPQEEEVIVRFRIDGVLQKRVVLPRAIHASIIARLKIMANLKIDEQRLPQDGRFQIDVDQKRIDFRFSTMPCVNGEKAVMRILDKSQGILTLEEIGLTGHGFDVLSQNIRKSHGMTLVTGPTGSGKTTTLYAILGKLMNVTVNIVTLEDPVEYRIPEINQSQVNSEIGYSFATSLRSVVRQDPDIIMLGEIRDRETAEMAVHAALTGHIVLSTLHTNDAAGAIPRLIDMSIEPFLLASSVNTIVGQRLTRRLCPHCKEEAKISDTEMQEVRDEIKRMPSGTRAEIEKIGLKFYKPVGCKACSNGYKGRQGVFEILDVTEEIKDLAIARSSTNKVQQKAIEQGMTTMMQDGILKAVQGITSLEEVWRVTRE